MIDVLTIIRKDYTKQKDVLNSILTNWGRKVFGVMINQI